MGLGAFVLLIALMIFAFVFGVRASRRQKAEIRKQVLEEREQFAGIIAVIKQGKSFQAENLLIRQGKQRSIARMTVAVIKDLIRNGELC